MGLSVCLPLPGNGQYQTQWDYVLSNFKPDTLYVLGLEDDAPDTNVFSKLSADYIETCADLPGGKELVLLNPINGRYYQGETSLVDFEHPQDAIYFFGNDVEWVSPTEFGGREPDHKVFIPTDTVDDMWSWVAYATVAWDRKMKNG